MAKKNKSNSHPIVPKRKERMKQAKGWIKTYTGDSILVAYREKYRVDVACALRELQELGYKFDDGYVEARMKVERIRIQQIHEEKAAKNRTEENYNDWQDDRFYFIAGHTSGGAPYGVTWEEMGLDPYGDEDDMDDIFDDDYVSDNAEESDGAICEVCKGNMLEVDGCNPFKLVYKGKNYERFKVGDIGDFFEDCTPDITCGDCGAKFGHYHHMGCDCEHCPICQGQLLSCKCKVGILKPI